MLRKIACTISLLRQKEADLCRSISFGKAKRDVDKGHEGHRSPAKKEYDFMESAEILLTDQPPPRVVGRRDWHAWQLFVSLLPPLGVFCLGMYGRRQMESMEVEAAKEREAAWEKEASELEMKEAERSQEQSQLQDRLDALEVIIRELQAQMKSTPEPTRQSLPPSPAASRPPADDSSSGRADLATKVVEPEGKSVVRWLGEAFKRLTQPPQEEISREEPQHVTPAPEPSSAAPHNGHGNDAAAAQSSRHTVRGHQSDAVSAESRPAQTSSAPGTGPHSNNQAQGSSSEAGKLHSRKLEGQTAGAYAPAVTKSPMEQRRLAEAREKDAQHYREWKERRQKRNLNAE